MMGDKPRPERSLFIMKGPLGAPAKTGQVTGAVKSSMDICNLSEASGAYFWKLHHVKKKCCSYSLIL